LNILLVEPDKVLARTVQGALEAAGHVVHWQAEAQAAVHALDEGGIHAIILELQLAAHNGIEFLHELRSYQEWEHIPVVIHTVLPRLAPAMGQASWEELGVADYLYTPHTPLKHLVQTIGRLPVRS
jgi:DNA-binding response OmpR family regulator